MASFIAALDQGTLSSRCLIFGNSLKAVRSLEHQQYHPHAGWTEQDPEEIFSNIMSCLDTAAADLVASGHSTANIKAVGITNQRETSIVWDKLTGKPLYPAIVWLDTRTKDLVSHFVQKTPSKSPFHFQDKCGLPFSTYFSALKLKWLLDNVESVKQAALEKRLCFGTMDSWLIYKLTGGAQGGIHVTDVTNASRTMLMNLRTLQWDPELCQFFDIPMDILPEIRSSAEVYGYVSEGPLKQVPIAGCLGDQQAALVGHKCFEAGQVKNTYGTGCFTLFNTGTQPVMSKKGLLTTVAFQLGKDSPVHYALEGSVAIAGAAIKWLKDQIGLIHSPEEINELAGKVNDTHGVYFVPAFSGLFAPHWRDDARGCIVGMTQYTNKCHIARATLEAVCFQSRDIIDCMNSDCQYPVQSLKVDGGLSNSDLMMQIQADFSGIRIERPRMRETTALGAAMAAGYTVGAWPSLKEFELQSGLDVFRPQMPPEVVQKKILKWNKAIQKSLDWIDEDEQ